MSTFIALFGAVTLGLADDRMPLFEISDDVPVGTTITTGATLGFLEYLGTNISNDVSAHWDGGEMIEFSNGIGVYARNKTIRSIIMSMEEAIEHMHQPSSALDTDGWKQVSTNPPQREPMYPAIDDLRRIDDRKEKLQKAGYKRIWYYKEKD